MRTLMELYSIRKILLNEINLIQIVPNGMSHAGEIDIECFK